MTTKRPRLTPDSWLRAGLVALADTGPEALKAEPLARRLGTTKGSFYWHFKDVPDFHARLLAHWQAAAHAAIAASLGSDLTPTQKLQRLGAVLHPEDADHGGEGVERALRAWAQSSPAAAEALEQVDRARMAFVADVLRALGLTNPDFPRLVYGAYLGMDALPGSEQERAGALSTLTAALLALQDA